LTSWQRQNRSFGSKNPQELKQQLTSEIATAEKTIQAQSEDAQKVSQLTLLKNSVKWNLGALISGFLFICIWRMTRWTQFLSPLNPDDE